MEISKPIFILGTRSSGKSTLSRLFTRHKDTAYFEHYIGNYINSRWKFRFLPILHKYRKVRHGIDRPNPVNVDFGIGFRYVDETDVTDKNRDYCYTSIKAALKLFNAKRFVNDSATHCLRIRWLNELFPDAYYIVIWRDPKAVVGSAKRKISENKKWSLLKEKFGKNLSYIETCIVDYQFFKNQLLHDLPLIKERTIEVHYENLIKNTRQELKRLYNFTELDWYDDIKKDIPSHLDRKNNEEWKNLSSNEQELLAKVFAT